MAPFVYFINNNYIEETYMGFLKGISVCPVCSSIYKVGTVHTCPKPAILVDAEITDVPKVVDKVANDKDVRVATASTDTKDNKQAK
jgi:hypothetical protein